jgi:hypothetical protein
MEDTLKRAGSGADDVVKLNVYVRDPLVTVLVEKTLAERYSGPHKPAVSFVTTRLPNAAHHVAVDAVAVCSRIGIKHVERLKPMATGKPAHHAPNPMTRTLFKDRVQPARIRPARNTFAAAQCVAAPDCASAFRSRRRQGIERVIGLQVDKSLLDATTGGGIPLPRLAFFKLIRRSPNHTETGN